MIIFLLILLSIITTLALASDLILDSELRKIKQNTINSLSQFYEPTNTQELQRWISTISNEGHWPKNISYLTGCDAPIANWPALTHLETGRRLSAAYIFDSSSRFNSDITKQTITKSLDYWMNTDYNKEMIRPDCGAYAPTRCNCKTTKGFWHRNWFYQIVSVPKLIGSICLTLAKDSVRLPDGTRQNCCERFLTRAINAMDMYPHANTIFIALNGIYLSLLRNDKSLFDNMWSRSLQTFAVSNALIVKEGFTRDGGYLFHDGQPTFATYGSWHLLNFMEFWRLTVGTSYERTFDRPEFNNIINFVTDGIRWNMWFHTAYRRPIFLPHVIAREISTPHAFVQLAGPWRRHPYREGPNNTVIMRPPIPESWPRQSELQPIWEEARTGEQSLIGVKIFWKSDLIIVRGLKYFFSLRLLSARTRNTECMNGQNLKGTHLADGTLFTSTHGNEYYNIFPVYDWYTIPGATVDRGNHPLDCRTMSQFGKERFVGGATDGIRLAAVMNFTSPYNMDGLSYRKAWFSLGGGEMVVMMNAISIISSSSSSSSSSNSNTKKRPDILTNLDQKTHGGGNTTISMYTQQNNTITRLVAKPDALLEKKWIRNAQWIHHDDIAYLMMQGGDSIELTQTPNKIGNWLDIGPGAAPKVPDQVTMNYISFSIRHAFNPGPTGPTTYIVKPGVRESNQVAGVYETYRQLYQYVNTPDAMAVFDRRNNTVTAAIFTRDKRLWIGPNYQIWVSEPAVIIFDFTRNRLTVADPTQLIKRKLIISINQVFFASNARVVTRFGEIFTQFEMELGQDGLAGSSVSVDFSRGVYIQVPSIINNII